MSRAADSHLMRWLAPLAALRRAARCLPLLWGSRGSNSNAFRRPLLAAILLLLLVPVVPSFAQAAEASAPCKQWISGAGIFNRYGRYRPNLLHYTVNVPANCGAITKTEFQIRTSGQSWRAVRWVNTGFGAFDNSAQPQSKEMFFNIAPSGQLPAPGLREMRIRAFNGSTVGPVSDVARLWIGLPAQPTGLRAAGGHKHVKLSWDDAENPSLRRWEYQQKSGSGTYGGWTPITVSMTRHRVSGTVSGLDNGTLYSFKIRAVNAAGPSTVSAEASATPVSGTPSAPSGLMATPGNGRVTLSWRPLGDSSVTKWQVRRKASSASWPTTSGGGWTDIAGSGASTARHPMTSLTNGTAYDFEIRAVSEVGNGGASAISATPTTQTVRTVEVPLAVEVEEAAGATAVVRIKTAAAFGKPVTFNVTYGSTATSRDNDATGAANPADGDYDNDAVPSVTFNAMETTKAISIPITDDLVDEGDETFTVTISASGSLPEGFVLGNATTTVTIAEDDVKRVTVSTDFLRIVEGGAGTYTVVLDTQPTSDVTVTVGGVPSGVTVSPAPLRFTPMNWRTPQTVTVRSPRHDPDGDDAELRLTHRASGGGYDGAPVRYVTDNTQPRTSLLVVVRDNNRKGVTLSASELEVIEGASGTYTVKLDTRPWGDVTLTVGGTSGEVTVSGSPLTFTSANWNEPQTVTVEAADDADLIDDTATLTHSASGGGYGSVKLGKKVVTVTVRDNDVPLPAKPTGFSATAGDGEATLSWTNPSNATIIGWKYQQKAGSGNYGDWLPIDDADAATTSHTVSGLTNYTSYGFKLRAVNGAGDGPVSNEATVTPIKPAPCKIGAADVRTSVPGGSGHAITFGVRIPANCGAITGLQYQVRSAGGTWGTSWTNFGDMATIFADSGSAQTPTGRETVAVAGGAAREVRVRALNVQTEGPVSDAVGATFVVPSLPTGLSATGGVAQVTLTWDAQPGEGITAWVVEYRQGSTGDWQSRVFKRDGSTTTVSVTGLLAVEYTLRLKARNVYGDSAATATVKATPTPEEVKPLPPAGLTAKAGPSSVTLTWNDPQNANIEWWGYQYRWTQGGEEKQKSATITPASAGAGKLTTTITGLTPGTSYRFTISLRNSVASTVSSWVTATPTVGLGIADVTAAEDGTFSFMVTSTPAPASAVTFNYKVTAESGDTATAGTDFTAVPAATATTLAASATSTTITVAVTDDGLDESDETFTVTLSDASSNATLTDATATGTITDDDSSPVLAALTAQTVKVGETVSVTAAATDADASDTISYKWTRKEGETTPALPPGTSVTDAELTFTATATGTYTMTVTASDGANSDSEEVVITVNPAANLVSVPATLTVAEGVGDATVRVTTEAAFGKSVTFAVSYGDGTATGAANPASGDYDNDAVASVTFGAMDTTQDIAIPITADDDVESAETFTVTIALAASNTLPDGFALANAMTTVTITDDDETAVTVTPTAVTVAEGASGTYKVKLGARPSGNVTVSVVGESGDVTTNPDSLTFTAQNYATAQTVTVSAADDADRLTDADVTLMHSAAGGGYRGVSINSVTVSVTEDDAPAKPTGLTAAPGNRAATLSWDDPSDASITGYQVSRRNAGATRWGGWANINGSGASTVSHTVTKLRNGTGYEFRIRARNGAGWSPVSDAVSVTPATLPVPTVTAEAGDGQVILRWSQLPGVGIRSWEWSHRGGAQRTWGPTALRLSRLDNNINHRTISSYLVGNLTNGVEYSFRLRAYNGRWSGWSAIVKATPGKATVSVPQTLRVAEGADTATVRVTASRAPDASVTFAVSYGGTATGASDPANGDYDNDAATMVTFGTMDTTKDIVIPLTDDGLDEPDETIVVTVALATTGGNALPDGFALGNASTTVTIADDDSSPMLADIADVSLSAGGTVDITAMATDADASDTITYAWTRKEGEDTPAIPQSTNLNQAQLTFATTAAGTYTMAVTASDVAGNSDSEDVTITVTQAKPAQPVNLLPTAGDGEVKLTWDDPQDASITRWEYRRKEGSKGWSSGWTNIALTDLDTSVSGKLSWTAENLQNGTAYRFRLRARNATGAGTFAQTAQVTPEKAPTAAAKTVSVPSVVRADEDDGSVTVTVTATKALGKQVSFDVSYAGTATGAATPGSGDDYDNDAVTSVQFGARDTTKDIVIPLHNDDVYEVNETILVTIALAEGNALPEGFTLGNTATTIMLSDDDDPPEGDEASPKVILTPIELSLNEGGGAQYTMVLDTAPTGPVTVKAVLVTRGGANRQDIGELLFEYYDWDEPQTGSVYAPIHDEFGDYSWTTEYTVEAAGTNYEGVAVDPLVVSVLDTTATLSLATDPAAVAEGSDISLTITSDREMAGALPLRLTLADRGSSGFAADDLPGGLTQTVVANFEGSLTATVTIPTNRDTAASEGAETYTITLHDDSDTNGYRLGEDVTAEGTLNDAASATPPTATADKGVTVTPTTLTVAEGGTATYTVVLDAAPTSNVTVSVLGAEVDKLEELESDVNFSTQGTGTWGELVFTTTSWDVPQWVRVVVREDADREDDAAVTLTHSASSDDDDYDLDTTAIDSVVVTVVENDKLAEAPGAEEGMGAGQEPEEAVLPPLPGRPRGLAAEAGDAQVALSWQPLQDATVTHWQVRVRRGTAKWSDWTAIAGSDGDTTGHTVTGLDNGTEYRFRVRAVNAAGAGTKSKRVFATPLKMPEIAIADASAKEGEELVFGITLSEPVAHQVKVAWRPVSGGSYGSARAGEDFVDASGVAVFKPGSTRVEVRLATLDDAHDEGRETFAVLLSAAEGGTIVDGEATGTIINSDPLPQAWLSRFGRSVAEQALEGIAARIGNTRGAGMGTGMESTMQRVPGFQGTIAGMQFGGGAGVGVGGAGANTCGAGAVVTDNGAADAGTAVADSAKHDAADSANAGTDKAHPGAGAEATNAVMQQTALTLTGSAAGPVSEPLPAAECPPARSGIAAQSGLVAQGGLLPGASMMPVTPMLGGFSMPGAMPLGGTPLGGAMAGTAVGAGQLGAGQPMGGMGGMNGMDSGGQPGQFGAAPGAQGGAAERDIGQLLLGSHFSYTRAEDAAGGVLGLWGRGAQTRFDGQQGELGLNGEVTTALLGADYAKNNWLLGVALTQTRSTGGYDGGAGGSSAADAAWTDGLATPPAASSLAGAVEASLTAAIPYGSWRPSERLALWGAVGHGSGDITLAPGAATAVNTAIGWSMAAAGVRSELWTFAEGGTLALVSDALWARTTSERTAGLVATAADIGRLRLGLEGSRRFALPGGGSLTPKLELGARRDSGDAETGFGLEIGGGLAWSAPRLGLELSIEGRTLLNHEDGAMQDRGFSASLSFDPKPDSARGLLLALRQELGAASSGGLDTLFGNDPLARRFGGVGGEMDGRWTLELGYGLPAFRDRFTGTPQLRYGFSAGGREIGLGWLLVPESTDSGTALDLNLSFEASVVESLLGPAEQRFGFRLQARW